jgi:hypothetical protein
MRISQKALDAAEKAAEAVRDGTDTPKRKKRVSTGVVPLHKNIAQWIEDPKQGCVFFDGVFYWVTIQVGKELQRKGLTEEEYLHPRKAGVSKDVKAGVKKNLVDKRKTKTNKKPKIVRKTNTGNKSTVVPDRRTLKRKVRSDKGKPRLKGNVGKQRVLHTKEKHTDDDRNSRNDKRSVQPTTRNTTTRVGSSKRKVGHKVSATRGKVIKRVRKTRSDKGKKRK